MRRPAFAILVAAGLAAGSLQPAAAAQAAAATPAPPAAAKAQSAEAAVAAAVRAMGAEGVSSIKMWGSGANFGIGQNNHPDGPWPRTNLNDYYRAIDFDRSASKATAVTWASPVT